MTEQIVYQEYDPSTGEITFVTQAGTVRHYNTQGASTPGFPTSADYENIEFVPDWRLGAATSQPKASEAHGEYFKLGPFVHVEINLQGITSIGEGTGSYEIYLPSEITPYTDNGVGTVNIWRTVVKPVELTGLAKWSLRNAIKGNKIIMILDGVEFAPAHLRGAGNFRLRLSMDYLVS